MALYYKGPNPTVDLVMQYHDSVTHTLKILLIQRKTEPFQGCWALPGGFVDGNGPKGELFSPIETPETAALRELLEETGIHFEGAIEPVGVYEGNGRDPRDTENAWTQSHAFTVTVPETYNTTPQESEILRCEWVCIHDILSGNVPLAFDHFKIIHDALHLAASYNQSITLSS